jgi:tRNA G18 (ribose-2'-O)-methylase SpoU
VEFVILNLDNADTTLVQDYLHLTDVALRRNTEEEFGIFIAEGELTIKRAIQSGFRLKSVLCEEKWLSSLSDVPKETPIILGKLQEMSKLTGYTVHRGALASFYRKELPSELLFKDMKKLLFLDGLVSHTNVGVIFRNAAAFGVDGVLITNQCADPLYRRAIRTSMGATFSIPWTRIENVSKTFELLRKSGHAIIGLTPHDSDLSLRDWTPTGKETLVLGSEMQGISTDVLNEKITLLSIPMKSGIDSLNVGSASAVVLYEYTKRMPNES